MSLSRRMDLSNVIAVWLLIALAASAEQAVEGNSTVNSTGFGYELTVSGLDAVNYSIQKEYLRSKEYFQLITAEMEDLRKTVANIEALAIRQSKILDDSIPSIKNELDLLSFNVTRLLNDISKIHRVQQTIPTTKMLNDFVLQVMSNQLRSQHSSNVALLETHDLPRTCADVESIKSGVQRVHPQPGFKGAFEAYCDQGYSGGGWTVIQNRFDGSVNFYRGWDDYENGFGNLKGEFWLGLKKIHELTYAQRHELHIVMEDDEGNIATAKYSNFLVGGPSEKYSLNSLGNYSGDAGDSLKYAINLKFTTLDSDNDTHGSENCAILFKSGWWHAACHESNLNGLYLKGKREEFATMVCWKAWKGYHYGLKRSRMMIRQVS